MKRIDAFSTMVTQSKLGVVRPRLYTLVEAAEELSVSMVRLSRVCQKHRVKPVFSGKPCKYSLNDVKKAMNSENIGAVPTFVIEKSIPVPPTHSSTLAKDLSEVLLKMEIGDSILMPAGQMVQAYKSAKDVGVAIVTRRTEDVTVRRVWKMAA